jgi:hypothetical protein
MLYSLELWHNNIKFAGLIIYYYYYYLDLNFWSYEFQILKGTGS